MEDEGPTLKNFSVNVTKSAGNCGFGYIYWRNPYWKTLIFVQCELLNHAPIRKFPLIYDSFI